MDIMEIQLPQGKTTIIDEADYELIKDRPWYINNRGYVAANHGIYLHRILMSHPEGLEVDHINHDPLDNRRANLRLCTHQQQCCNRKRHKNNTSGYMGVGWEKRRQKWLATIYLMGRRIFVGRFITAEEAARAYDKAARRLHGEFATLNFP